MKYCLPISSSSEHGRHFNKHWFMETWHHYNKCTLVQTIRNFLLCLWKSWCNHSWETASRPDYASENHGATTPGKQHPVLIALLSRKLQYKVWRTIVWWGENWKSKFIKLQIASGGGGGDDRRRWTFISILEY